ncbi:MAG: hypothetical protein WAW61_22300 [Methylococcaceae bacterium]
MKITHSPTRLRELADAKEKKAQGKTGAVYHNLMQQVRRLRAEAEEIEGKK